ncbi:helix-turn-helix domain-containing protein [Paenibacillus mucilaginosus]|uniref:XRE family transcriptional regulator n=3 Tax=Paenibacillus mucilaginosus TaxID=61624 RepID=H6NE13_9BACL|nr:helix-turn-helix transcriptional regulator [Paenibacillus mucilaginosus]AEI45229.1 transcriptional regulator, XRE family [Paenibacillus mucilaginosus KNP414]AFC32966.1 XRE family transcriptional regulator [Paenibacillus mucilaginosus 3016]AFH65278.1 XRE family transcriptional regulator [Paenibacillus mucilaginosus K02]MCG7212883.1 helix-turn-helix domain-containing protein [Paenibacillus mucilaginosus]WDM26699.1 helix-turn-helix transcriptional regulator [Paenibacillus mucilaginosus]
MIRIGDKIALLREKHGLTQEDLSRKLEISRASLSHYEKNRREPDYETIVRIADHFKVSMDYLMGRTEDPHSVLDPEVRDFVDSLELSDEKIIGTFSLTIDGKKLTVQEAKRFIAFVRAERSI